MSDAEENQEDLIEEEPLLEEEGAAMSLRQQYKHAIRLDKTTSRMSNKDWYRDALELDVQLHCYIVDEARMDCYLHIQSSAYYEVIGQCDLNALEKKESQVALLQGVLESPAVKKAKAKSIGVVLYLADEFLLACLGPEHSDPETLVDLAHLIEEDPREVLEDKTLSVDSHSWRMFPYVGASNGGEFATAVAVPRKMESFLAHLREFGNDTNFPVRTVALAAPLVGVASLPWCASANPQGTVAVYNYAKFTTLAFFNAQCDLVMLRHIAHAQGAPIPRNLGPLLFSAATSFELENPEVYIFPMVGANVENEVLSVQTAMASSAIMVVNAEDVLLSRNVTVPIPLEVLTMTSELDASIYPLAGNATFSSMLEEGWLAQDFLPPSRAEEDLTPSAMAMRMLKISRWVKVVAVLALTALIVVVGMDVMKKVTSEMWLTKPNNDQARLVALQNQINEYTHWDALLKDRSKGWVSMELVSELVPDDGSILLTSVEHRATRSKDQKSGMDLVKTWNVSGKMTVEQYQKLDEDYNKVNSEKVKDIFRRVVKKTGDSSYDPDVKGRDLTVKFSRVSSGGGRSRSSQGKEKLPITFKLIITQSYPKTDPVSLTGVK